MMSKATRRPRRQVSQSSTPEVGSYFVSDVKMMPEYSRSGYRYIVTFVDKGSRFVKVYFLKKKSEVGGKTKDFLAWVHTQRGKYPRKMGSDGGGEYIAGELKEMCEKLGIEWEYTEADSPWQNGIAERINRTIVEGSNALLLVSGLGIAFWEDAVEYFIYIKNRTPHATIHMNKPIDLWNRDLGEEEISSVLGVKTFGCEAYMTLRQGTQRGKRVVYLGKCMNRKSDKFYDMEKEKVVFGYSQYFDEDTYPMGSSKSCEKSETRGKGGQLHSPAPYPSSSKIGTQSTSYPSSATPSEERGSATNKVTKESFWKTIFDKIKIDDGAEEDAKSNENEQNENEQKEQPQREFISRQPPKEGRTKLAPEEEKIEEQDSVSIESRKTYITPAERFEIEEIIGKRKSRFKSSNSTFDYLVRWKGCNSEDDTWLPKRKISANELIQTYEINVNERTKLENEKRQREVTSRQPPKEGCSTTEDEQTQELEDLEDSSVIGIETAKVFLATVCPPSTPLTRGKAQLSPDWPQFQKGEEEEIKNALELGCLKQVKKSDIPQGATILGSTWVYKKKPKTALEEARFRSRLCVLGNRQTADSYSETYAAVAKVKSFRLLLAISVFLGLGMSQLDISNAFMNADLPEEIYMYPPKGHEYLGMLKLDKSLYGLKQAPRLWYDRLSSELIKLGFQRLDSDVCCFKHTTQLCYILIYVDDVVICTNDELLRFNLVKELKTLFKLRHFETAKLYVGLELVWSTNKTQVTVKQSKYIKDMLTTFRMNDANPSDLPSQPKEILHSQAKQSAKEQKLPYMELVGSLLFLLGSRPDVTQAVRQVSQFMSCYTAAHWYAAKRILSYLVDKASWGIRYTKQKTFKVVAYSDSNYAEDKDDRKSITGYVIFVQDGPLIWKSKKQSIVAQSTCEAEYIALAECIKELMWLKMALFELGIPVDGKVIVYVDNRAAKALANNQIDHERSKHIDIRYHLVKYHVQAGWLEVRSIPSKNNYSDIFTKSVDFGLFKTFISRMMVRD
jgi:hypothetical protein